MLAHAAGMDDLALRLRIRVISVSTRAAVNSLGSDDPQVRDVLKRGQSLLDGLEPFVLDGASDDVRREFAEARAELVSMDGQREP
ncbi:MAG: hypothetical protein ACT4OQ_01255 [Chloroflexota bacterium]